MALSKIYLLKPVMLLFEAVFEAGIQFCIRVSCTLLMILVKIRAIDIDLMLIDHRIQ